MITEKQKSNRMVVSPMFDAPTRTPVTLCELSSGLVPAPEHARESALLLREWLRAGWGRGVHEEIRKVGGRRVAGVCGLTCLTWRRLLAGTRSRLALQGNLSGVVRAGTRWGGRVGWGDRGVFLWGGGRVLWERGVARENGVARKHRVAG